VHVLAWALAISCAVLLIGAGVLMILVSTGRGTAWLRQLGHLRHRKHDRYGKLIETGTVAKETQLDRAGLTRPTRRHKEQR
jgi:hypothetical protein